MTNIFRGLVPVAQVLFGKGLGQAISIYGLVAAELGIPTVGVTGALEDMQAMKPETAEQIAQGLLLAVRQARGEALPTPLDAFLAKRAANDA